MARAALAQPSGVSDLSISRVASLGLNPSNREFVDAAGDELDGPLRRFHTLRSLGLAEWSDASDGHLGLIAESCQEYFWRNPYDGWFRRLDKIVAGAKASYYDGSAPACHLDLIPFATAAKWTDLSGGQRAALMTIAGDTLGLLLRTSPVQVLILNGRTVVENFESLAGVELERRRMKSWGLPRKGQPDVAGYAYFGRVRKVAHVDLERTLLILGYNHNIQSSFGVTTAVINGIRHWVSEVVAGERQ